jgi:hypothetical protein
MINFFLNCLKNLQIYFIKGIKINIGVNKRTLSIFKVEKYNVTIMIEISRPAKRV